MRVVERSTAFSTSVQPGVPPTGEISQYYHFDALGSPVALTTDAGALAVRYRWDAWGNLRDQVGDSPNPFGFTGHELDEETGLYYAKARYYDPELGRFLTQDPFEGLLDTPPSLHRYLYAYQNPTVYWDPDGREVRVLDDLALERIRSTLPRELRETVVVGPDGLVKQDPINQVETDDPNFLALRELVNAKDVVAVKTAPGILEGPFSFKSREQVIKEYELVLGGREAVEEALAVEGLTIDDVVAEPLLGVFREGKEIESGEPTVVVADESVKAPLIEHAKTTAHELYGHALLYIRGEPYLHPRIPGQPTAEEAPDAVFREIEKRTEEMLLREKLEGPGTIPESLRRPDRRRR